MHDDLRPGEFWAFCNRMSELEAETAAHQPGYTAKTCRFTTHDYASLEAHIRKVHPDLWRGRLKPTTIGGDYRPRPSRPAVRQPRLQPGTEFFHQGHRCQVVGQISPARVRFVAWLPEGYDPRNPSAVCHGADGDTVMWEMTAPLNSVVSAVLSSADQTEAA